MWAMVKIWGRGQALSYEGKDREGERKAGKWRKEPSK